MKKLIGILLLICVIFMGCEGPAGPTGPAGSQGPEGSVGPQGPAGSQGPEGPVGPQGLAGSQGPAGPTGSQGPVGNDGIPGMIWKGSYASDNSPDLANPDLNWAYYNTSLKEVRIWDGDSWETFVRDGARIYTVNALDLSAIVGAPIIGVIAVNKVIDTEQYIGTIFWQTSGGESFNGTFSAGSQYKSIVNLHAKSGWSFTGIAANSFFHGRSEGCTNNANSGNVTLSFNAITAVTNATDLQTYLEGITGGNTVNNPISVAITGVVTLEELYTALAFAGKYVSLDLSESGITSWAAGGVAGGKPFLVNIIMPNSLTEIGDDAFWLDVFPNLKSVIAANVEYIGGFAFYNCTSLTNISFPSVTIIGGYAFTNCPLLTVNFSKLTTINQGAFTDCGYLVNIDLPMVTSLGSYSFTGCSSLVSISLPALLSIGDGVFQSCSNLETITLGINPPTLSSGGVGPFYGISSFTLKVPAGSKTAYENWAIVNGLSGFVIEETL